MNLLRTDSTNADFQRLVADLDAELRSRDGADHSFYSQFNKIDALRHVVVAFEDKEAVGCGAFKEYAPRAVEVKRMFVIPARRKRGIAAMVLKELEAWAQELGVSRVILETGKRQPEAINLYEKNGYRVTDNYGQYIGVDNSVCFEKRLGPNA